MAAAIYGHLAARRSYVASAGVRAGSTDGFAVQVMDEIGIDMSKHTPHTLDELNDTSFDLIVSLSPEAHHQALELTRTMAVDVEYWPTLDPALISIDARRDAILDQYRQVRDELFQRVKSRFPLPGSPNI